MCRRCGLLRGVVCVEGKGKDGDGEEGRASEHVERREEESVVVARQTDRQFGMERLMDKCAFRPMMMGWSMMIWDMHEGNDIDALLK